MTHFELTQEQKETLNMFIYIYQNITISDEDIKKDLKRFLHNNKMQTRLNTRFGIAATKYVFNNLKENRK